MKTEVIVAGHGGQGVLELANWLAYVHLVRGHHVAYTPSYGPETRGGKVKCYVVASDDPIDSPIVEAPDLLIVMNIPSMDYAPLLKPGGTLLVNSSLVKDVSERSDVTVVDVPAIDLATALAQYSPVPGKETSIAANSVMLGAVLAIYGDEWEGEQPTIEGVFRHFLTDRKAAFIPLNVQAVKAGFEYAARLEPHSAPAGLRPFAAPAG
jgi:2-oxoglutarate ferredoxin oxidoreductase subunit gamma